MAMKPNTPWAVLLIIILFFLYNQPAGTTTGVPDSDVDLSKAVDSSVAFTGQNLYVKSLDVGNESVRIVKLNGEGVEKDLGSASLNGGTLSTAPNEKYRFYYFMNTTEPSYDYYVMIEDYTQPVQDSVVDKVGYGCQIDRTPTFSVKDTNGNTQTASANAQAVTAGTTVSLSMRMQAHTHRCYGMPTAEDGNTVCFAYNTSTFASIETGSKPTVKPSEILNNITVGLGLACYEFDKVQNGEIVEIPVILNAGSTEPTTKHNISVYTEDIAFDLHDDTLAEMFTYNDEKDGTLAAPMYSAGTIYIS